MAEKDRVLGAIDPFREVMDSLEGVGVVLGRVEPFRMSVRVGEGMGGCRFVDAFLRWVWTRHGCRCLLTAIAVR